MKWKIQHIVLLLIGLCLFKLSIGQVQWDPPDSIQKYKIQSLHLELQNRNQESISKRDSVVLDLAKSYLISGLAFTTDTLIDRYVNKNYETISAQIQSQFSEISQVIDSLRRWINTDHNSQIIVSYLEAELKKENLDSKNKARIQYDLGQVFFLVEDYNGFKVIGEKRLAGADHMSRPDVLLDIAAGYFYLDKFNMDSAIYYAQEAIGQLESMQDIPRLSYANTQLATMLLRKGKNRKALHYYLTAYDLAKSTADILTIDLASNYLATYYEMHGKSEKAIPILREVMANKSNKPDFGSPFDTPNHSISQFIRAENVVTMLVKQRQRLFVMMIFIGLGGVIVILFLRLRARKREADLLQQISRIQINPHFIFNSLNSLQRFIIENDIGASNKYLTRFSNLIRSVLNNTQEDYIPVMDEIKFLEDYLALEKLRFKNQFSFKVNVNQNVDIYNMMLPTMLVQPFVENSLWHGLVPLDRPGDIQIHFDASDLICLRCTIIDNGIGRKRAKEIKGKSSKRNSSVGTSLIKTRLDQLSKVNKSVYKFEYQDLSDDTGFSLGTKVILSIPLKWRKNKK